MFDVTLYSLAIFVHVLAAVALTGHAFAAPLQHRLVREASTTTDLLRWLELARLEARFNPVIALVLLATGVYLGSFGWWSQPWFYVAIGAWLASSLLATRVIQPSAASLARAAAQARPGPITPAVETLRRSRASTLASAAMLGIDVALLFVMFNKPSLAGSLALVLGAIVASCAVRLIGARSPKAAAQRLPATVLDAARS